MSSRPGLAGNLDALAAAPLPELAPPRTVSTPTPKTATPKTASKEATAQVPSEEASAGSLLGPAPTPMPRKRKHQYSAYPEQIEQLQRLTAFLQSRGYQLYTGDVITRAVDLFEEHVVKELNGGQPLPSEAVDPLVRGHF